MIEKYCYACGKEIKPEEKHYLLEVVGNEFNRRLGKKEVIRDCSLTEILCELCYIRVLDSMTNVGIAPEQMFHYHKEI